MATRGRKPNEFTLPKTPKERKSDFDQKMRNKDGLDPNAPSRKAHVIYLSDPARAVLQRHRVERRLFHVDSGPKLDSELVEQLLLAMETETNAKRVNSNSAQRQAYSKAARAETLNALKETKRQLGKVRTVNTDLRKKIEKLENDLAEKKSNIPRASDGRRDQQIEDPSGDGNEIAKELIKNQQSQLWLWGPRFLTNLREILHSHTNDAELIRIIARELDDHIAILCDSL